MLGLSRFSKDVGLPSRKAASKGSDRRDGTGTDARDEADEVPTKLVSTTMRVQFTCGFKDVASCSGRADLKAMKTIITKLTPSRVVVLRGHPRDCEAVAVHARGMGIEAYAPHDGDVIHFPGVADRLRLQIPQDLLPPTTKGVRGAGVGADSTCKISALTGTVLELASGGSQGSRTIRLCSRGTVEGASQGGGATAGSGSGSGLGPGSKKDEAERPFITDEEVCAYLDCDTSLLVSSGEGRDDDGGGANLLQGTAVSVGEVTLNALKQKLEQRGVTVEFKLSSVGGMLVCGGQVLMKKQENDFVLEGPPVPAYWEARKALYEHFAFV